MKCEQFVNKSTIYSSCCCNKFYFKTRCFHRFAPQRFNNCIIRLEMGQSNENSELCVHANLRSTSQTDFINQIPRLNRNYNTTVGNVNSNYNLQPYLSIGLQLRNIYTLIDVILWTFFLSQRIIDELPLILLRNRFYLFRCSINFWHPCLSNEPFLQLESIKIHTHSVVKLYCVFRFFHNQPIIFPAKFTCFDLCEWRLKINISTDFVINHPSI